MAAFVRAGRRGAGGDSEVPRGGFPCGTQGPRPSCDGRDVAAADSAGRLLRLALIGVAIGVGERNQKPFVRRRSGEGSAAPRFFVSLFHRNPVDVHDVLF